MSLTASLIAGLFIIGLPLMIYLLQPLLQKKPDIVKPDKTALEVDELLTERERSYTALADLDFDYESGKISQEDYEPLRAALMDETAHVLARIDERIAEKHRESPDPHKRKPARRPAAPSKPSASEDALEREIARFKRAKAQSPKVDPS